MEEIIGFDQIDNSKVEDVHAMVEEKILNELIPIFNPKAIILCGSFGRGEPTIIREMNNYVILSDCEISVVPNRYISKKQIHDISLNLSKATGVKCVISRSYGLKLLSSWSLPLSLIKHIWKPTIQKYDLKHGSTVIYGEDIIKKMPDIGSNDIPLWEGIRLLLNRIAEMLSFFNISDLRHNKGSSELSFWMSKTIIACQDSILLSKGIYHSSYKKRNELFNMIEISDNSKLNLDPLRFKQLARTASLYKISPNLSSEEFKSLDQWFEVKNICDTVFRYIITTDMSIDFDSYSCFQKKYLNCSKIKTNYYNEIFASPIYRNILKLNCFRNHPSMGAILNMSMPWTHIVYSMIPLIYFSLNDDLTVNRELLDPLRESLNIFIRLDYPKDDLIEEWEYLKEKVVYLWSEFCN